MNFEEWLHNQPEYGFIGDDLITLLERTWKASESQVKPNWNDAPAECNWMAMNNVGSWNWFKYEPYYNNHFNTWVAGGTEYYAGHCGRFMDATQTLEARTK